jgi:histone deacetylase 6
MGCLCFKEKPIELNYETLADSKSTSSKHIRVGFVTNQPYDIPHCNEKAITHNQDEHDGERHPECHDRVAKLWEALESGGYLKQGVVLTPRRAQQEEIDLVHTREHQQDIAGEQVRGHWEKSVYLSPGSFDAALTAAGSVLELVQEVWKKNLDRGFAIVRPPGHHAEVARAQGFCLFNNVALGAAWLTKVGGAKRVAIVDWDVHAGNGQQEIFYNNPSVLTISIHRYDHAKFYPFSEDGAPIRVGGPNARGSNINIAWNVVKSYGDSKNAPGDGEYKYAFEKVVLPSLEKFKPEFILVAAGFDAAKGDPLGGLNVTPQGYEWMTRQLCALNVPVVLTLEGGYNIHNLKTCGSACASALLDFSTTSLYEFNFPSFHYMTDVAMTSEMIRWIS